MKRTPYCCCVVSMVVVALVSIRCGETNVPSNRVITLGTFSSAIDYAPYYVARHFDWFAESLREKEIQSSIDYKEFGSVPEIGAAFRQDSLHALFSAEAPATVLVAGGNEIRIVEVSCTLQQEIVVRADLSVRTVADLKGRKVAVLAGTSSHYGLLRILKDSNLVPSNPDAPGAPFDVEVIFMPPPAARTAFDAREIDGWAVWPPFVEQLEVSKAGVVIKGGDAVIQSVMSVPESELIRNDEISRALVATIQRAKRWCATNPDEAQNIVAHELNLELDVVRTAWPKHNWAATLTDDVVEDISQKADFLADTRVTDDGTRVTVEQLLDRRFVQNEK